MDRLKISLILITLMIALSFSSNAVSAVRIKIATKAPENFKSSKIIKKMAEEIKEKTNDKVRLKFYYGGVKGSGRDLLLKMRSGEIHGGEFTSGETMSVTSDLQLMGIPFSFNNYEEADYVFKKITARLNEKFIKKDYVVLGWIEIGFAHIMSVEPIGSMADLKGKKVWIPEGDRVSKAFFEAMNVPTIPMTIADVMVALQTGQINTVANSFVGAIALQWHTRIKYITHVPLLYVYGLLMITREAYDKIPAEYRDTVHEVVDRHFIELKKDIRKSNQEASETLVKRGIQFVHVSPENYKELKHIVEKVTKKLSGSEFPADGLKLFRQYLKEYRKSHQAEK